MKRLKFLFGLLIIAVMTNLQSCSEEGFSDEIDGPQMVNTFEGQTKLKIVIPEGEDKLIYTQDVITLEQFWTNESLDWEVHLESGMGIDAVAKIEFFLNLEEEGGYNSQPPFSTNGMLVKTYTEIPEDGVIAFSLSGEEVSGAFQGLFRNTRAEYPFLEETDIFELEWVITSNDGEVFDSREYASQEYRAGFSYDYTLYSPPSFAGTFDFEWIELSDGGATYGGVSLGGTGSVTIPFDSYADGIGTFSMNNLLFDYYYGTAGTIYYNFETGLVTIEGSLEEKWNIVNIDGPHMDIAWEYRYTAGYDESGTVRLTRTDGKDWPEEMYTE